MNDVLVGGSLFLHIDTHKCSWTLPDGMTNNQIDHCLIGRKWCSSLQDIQTYRGADESDHNLVIAKLCLKLKKIHNKKSVSKHVLESEKGKGQV
ncbi:hypothetical protein QYM36_003652 [Artemia franciscana]|uniref:Uncharacterized protein n=1 Tax=Artemia franciscana TaxID=6661 RepID=A0AA88I7R8_ARTSF|nr:hypothetical protein QYM36_003652 [Artemia franciscana]